MGSEIKSFRDLHVWQKASDLATLIYKETEDFPKAEVYGLSSQMRRSVVSISSNIAEGFKRSSHKEKLQFYNIANGSLSELESQVEISQNLHFINEGSYKQILESVEEESKMLNSLIRTTKRNSSSYTAQAVVIFFLYSLFSLLYSPSAAVAAEVGLGVTKNTLDISILKGSSHEDSLVVFNRSGDVALPVSLQLSPWNIDENEDIEFLVAEPALNAATWFELEGGNNFILEPNASRQIKFRINPHEDAPLGSFFAMMRLQAVIPEHYFEEEGLRVYPEIGVLFFIKHTTLSLEGNSGVYNARVVQFEGTDVSLVPLLDKIIPVAEASVLEDIVRTFAAKIKNTGLYHFQTSGTVEIKNLFGGVVAAANLPPKYLIPNKNRSFDVEVIGEGESFWRRNTYFGPYTAQLSLNIPGSDIPLVIKEQFWVFPWKTILILGVLFLFIFFARKRLKPAIRALLRVQTP